MFRWTLSTVVALVTLTNVAPGTAQTVSTYVTGIVCDGDLAVDGHGNLFISSEHNDTVIRKVTPEGVVSIFSTTFNDGRGLAVEATGDTLFAANNILAGPIKRIAPDAHDTTIAFELARSETVRLAVYDAGGRMVRTLVRGTEGPGRHEARWDGRTDAGGTAAPGVYFYRLEAAGEARSARMTRVR
jgi:hypothetical protein